MDPVTLNLALTIAGALVGALAHWKFPFLNKWLGSPTNGSTPAAPVPAVPAPVQPTVPAASKHPILQLVEQVALDMARQELPSLGDPNASPQQLLQDFAKVLAKVTAAQAPAKAA